MESEQQQQKKKRKFSVWYIILCPSLEKNIHVSPSMSHELFVKTALIRNPLTVQFFHQPPHLTATSRHPTTYTLFIRLVITGKPFCPILLSLIRPTLPSESQPLLRPLGGTMGKTAKEIKSDITGNLYVIKEGEGGREVGCWRAVSLSLVKHKESSVQLEGRRSVFAVFIKSLCGGRREEVAAGTATDPRCLICRLADGHLMWGRAALPRWQRALKRWLLCRMGRDESRSERPPLPIH